MRGPDWIRSWPGQNGRIDRIFLAIISLAVLGKLTNSILSMFEKWAVEKWA